MSRLDLSPLPYNPPSGGYRIQPFADLSSLPPVIELGLERA